MPLLQARDRRKSYAGKPALQGVSLQLFPGEMVTLLCPNGSGKSTLMQLLTGLGVVYQQTALDLDLSVQANLLFHTDLHGLSRGRIAEALSSMGLDAQAGAVVRS